MNKSFGILSGVFFILAAASLCSQESDPDKGTQPIVHQDQTKQVINSSKYPKQNQFSEGLASASDGSKFGFIDPQGHWVIEPQFGEVLFGFKNGLAWVYDKIDQGPKVLIIDRTGKTVNTLDEEIFSPYYFSNKGAFGNLIWDIDCKGSPRQCREIWYDRKGNVVFEREIDHISPKGAEENIDLKDKRRPADRPAVMTFSKKGKWGLKDRNDQVLLKPKYEFVEVLTYEKTFDESAAIIEETDEDGYLQKGFIITWKDGKLIQTQADKKQIEKFERIWFFKHKSSR